MLSLYINKITCILTLCPASHRVLCKAIRTFKESALYSLHPIIIFIVINTKPVDLYRYVCWKNNNKKGEKEEKRKKQQEEKNRREDSKKKKKKKKEEEKDWN